MSEEQFFPDHLKSEVDDEAGWWQEEVRGGVGWERAGE